MCQQRNCTFAKIVGQFWNAGNIPARSGLYNEPIPEVLANLENHKPSDGGAIGDLHRKGSHLQSSEGCERNNVFSTIATPNYAG